MPKLAIKVGFNDLSQPNLVILSRLASKSQMRPQKGGFLFVKVSVAQNKQSAWPIRGDDLPKGIPMAGHLAETQKTLENVFCSLPPLLIHSETVPL